MARSKVRIVGVYPVIPTQELLDETRRLFFGDNVDFEALEAMREQVQDHYDGLRIVEVEFDPPNDDFDYQEFTQPQFGQPPENWQVPYDERPLDDEGRRWAFFLHRVQDGPLSTSEGPVPTPASCPVPPYLQHMADSYDPPT